MYAPNGIGQPFCNAIINHMKRSVPLERLIESVSVVGRAVYQHGLRDSFTVARGGRKILGAKTTAAIR